MTATGVSHLYNQAKYRILKAIYEMTKKGDLTSVTAKEIAEYTGMGQHNVEDRLSHYSKRVKKPLILRGARKSACYPYKYRVSEAGIKWLRVAYNRRQRGYDLNFKHLVCFPKWQPKVKPNKRGLEAGLDLETAREAVGL
ncbi:hypothetical protein [Methanosarcina sp. WH1]|uniref:hypothetical protein n=1 Tax=Methanosarcina sp. WH1 TaxID=1434102 RepID=UPI00064E9C25|nr:hypothetical protein [Methanosarcina sp. WH1]